MESNRDPSEHDIANLLNSSEKNRDGIADIIEEYFNRDDGSEISDLEASSSESEGDEDMEDGVTVSESSEPTVTVMDPKPDSNVSNDSSPEILEKSESSDDFDEVLNFRCKCKMGKDKAPCSTMFSPEFVLQRRLNMLDMSSSEYFLPFLKY